MSDANAPRIEFRYGNIAAADCDAIVNPCNSGFLLSHAGVNGALTAAAGPTYAAECEQLPARAKSYVLVTGAGVLQARYVIHAVSPIWHSDGHARDALRRVHERVLAVAARLGCTSLAFPAIGTGAHRFPPEVAASIAVPTVEAVLQHDRRLARVLFVFQTRQILHDYLARSTSPDTHAVLIAGLRDEISSSLRDAGRADLAETVDAITDETTLRAIIAEAHAMSHDAHSASDNFASLSISRVCVQSNTSSRSTHDGSRSRGKSLACSRSRPHRLPVHPATPLFGKWRGEHGGVSYVRAGIVCLQRLDHLLVRGRRGSASRQASFRDGRGSAWLSLRSSAGIEPAWRSGRPGAEEYGLQT
jgi:O-acetyl-ADP-ribose deacetylase (regulator of RNase III)